MENKTEENGEARLTRSQNKQLISVEDLGGVHTPRRSRRLSINNTPKDIGEGAEPENNSPALHNLRRRRSVSDDRNTPHGKASKVPNFDILKEEEGENENATPRRRRQAATGSQVSTPKPKISAMSESKNTFASTSNEDSEIEIITFDSDDVNINVDKNHTDSLSQKTDETLVGPLEKPSEELEIGERTKNQLVDVDNETQPDRKTPSPTDKKPGKSPLQAKSVKFGTGVDDVSEKPSFPKTPVHPTKRKSKFATDSAKNDVSTGLKSPKEFITAKDPKIDNDLVEEVVGVQQTSQNTPNVTKESNLSDKSSSNEIKTGTEFVPDVVEQVLKKSESQTATIFDNGFPQHREFHFAPSWTQGVHGETTANLKMDCITPVKSVEAEQSTKLDPPSIHIENLWEIETNDEVEEEEEERKLDGFVSGEAEEATDVYHSGDSLDDEERREMADNEVFECGESLGSQDTEEEERTPSEYSTDSPQYLYESSSLENGKVKGYKRLQVASTDSDGSNDDRIPIKNGKTQVLNSPESLKEELQRIKQLMQEKRKVILSRSKAIAISSSEDNEDGDKLLRSESLPEQPKSDHELESDTQDLAEKVSPSVVKVKRSTVCASASVPSRSEAIATSSSEGDEDDDELLPSVSLREQRKRDYESESDTPNLAETASPGVVRARRSEVGASMLSKQQPEENTGKTPIAVSKELKKMNTLDDGNELSDVNESKEEDRLVLESSEDKDFLTDCSANEVKEIISEKKDISKIDIKEGETARVNMVDDTTGNEYTMKANAFENRNSNVNEAEINGEAGVEHTKEENAVQGNRHSNVNEAKAVSGNMAEEEEVCESNLEESKDMQDGNTNGVTDYGNALNNIESEYDAKEKKGVSHKDEPMVIKDVDGINNNDEGDEDEINDDIANEPSVASTISASTSGLSSPDIENIAQLSLEEEEKLQGLQVIKKLIKRETQAILKQKRHSLPDRSLQPSNIKTKKSHTQSFDNVPPDYEISQTVFDSIAQRKSELTQKLQQKSNDCFHDNSTNSAHDTQSPNRKRKHITGGGTTSPEIVNDLPRPTKKPKLVINDETEQCLPLTAEAEGEATKDKDSFILKACNDILGAVNKANLQAKINYIENKINFAKSAKRKENKLKKTKKNTVFKHKDDKKQALEKALRASAEIILNPPERKKKKAQLKIFPKDLKSRRLPNELLDSIATLENNEKLPRNKIEEHSSDAGKLTVQKSRTGDFNIQPISPQIKEPIEEFQLATGTVRVEPSTPVSKTASREFRESSITPPLRSIGQKVRKILSAGQDTPPSLSMSHTQKSRKRKCVISEPSYTLRKPVQSRSGVFMEEQESPPVRPLASAGSTVFGVCTLNGGGAVQRKTKSYRANAGNFKIDYLLRDDIPRESARTLLQQKQRRLANQIF